MSGLAIPIFILTLTTVFALGVNQAGRMENMNLDPFDEVNWPPINYNAHIFYYPWYKNQTFDGHWFHWNEPPPAWATPHKVLYDPPRSISSVFYPILGAYSSNDTLTVDQHFRWIRSTGVGVVAVSWYPPQFAPGPDADVDKLMPLYFKVAQKYKLKIAFLVEKYPSGKSGKYGGDTIKMVSKYVMDTYGNEPALYKMKIKHRKGEFPLYYMYAANELDPKEWAPGLQPGGPKSVRGTKYDGIFAMLFMYPRHYAKAYRGGFDALFTYFSIRNYVYGSTWSIWNEINEIANSFNMTFIPSFGPGYDDLRIRPWNRPNLRGNNETYYETAFRTFIADKLPFLSITSWNEWHEGSQIEPCRPSKTIDHTYNPDRNQTDTTFTYKEYPNNGFYFLDVTRKYVGQHRLTLE